MTCMTMLLPLYGTMVIDGSDGHGHPGFLNTLVTIIVVIGYGTYFIKKLVKFIKEYRK